MGVKPLVLASPEDESGTRCVDILQTGTRFGWRECRRDPEDGTGWRVIGQNAADFTSREEAEADARAAIGWLA